LVEKLSGQNRRGFFFDKQIHFATMLHFAMRGAVDPIKKAYDMHVFFTIFDLLSD